MSRMIYQLGNAAHKPLTQIPHVDGEWLAQASVKLAQAGLLTPIAHYDSCHHSLVMPWIEGNSCTDELRQAWRDAGGDWRLLKPILRRMLKLLVQLHGIDPSALDLQALNPWRRITPRLVTAHEAVQGMAHYLQYTLPEQVPDPVVLHGDFHAGQLLVDSSGKLWLLDLDDLALGPPEHDIGNLAAWLSTFSGRPDGNLVEKHELLLLSILQQLYTELGGRRLNTALLRLAGAIALLRRGLKLRNTSCKTSAAAFTLVAAHIFSNLPEPRTRVAGDKGYE